MKQSTVSRLLGFLFGALMLLEGVLMGLKARDLWGRNLPWALVYVGLSVVCLGAAWLLPQLWRKTAKMWAFTERIEWETERIREGTYGEWAHCGTCQRRLPRLAFRQEGGILTCYRCSPEAKAVEYGKTNVL